MIRVLARPAHFSRNLIAGTVVRDRALIAPSRLCFVTSALRVCGRMWVRTHRRGLRTDRPIEHLEDMTRKRVLATHTSGEHTRMPLRENRRTLIRL
eukprot:814422-Pleurochrysis_carterae.AAC.1